MDLSQRSYFSILLKTLWATSLIFLITLNPLTGYTKAKTDKKGKTTSMAKVTELKIEDLKVGTGVEAQSGKTVTVHYSGWLTDGKKFDSSLDRGQPFTFHLGQGEVIQGWDQGVKGMKVGGKRKLTIPSQLAYGERGAGSAIPPNSPLIFEVELLKAE